MYLNAMRIRFGLMGAGLVMLAIWIFGGGSIIPNKGVIQIEFGMYPEEFEGLEVEIDGEVVGELQYFGAASRTGFEVKEGDHTVRIIHPEFESRTQSVEVTASRNVLLILDYYGTMNRDGTEHGVIGFQ